jgi:hypothetical protein
VTFNNLVQEIAFSQPFFDPTLGQTQLVTAVFASIQIGPSRLSTHLAIR